VQARGCWVGGSGGRRRVKRVRALGTPEEKNACAQSAWPACCGRDGPVRAPSPPYPALPEHVRAVPCRRHASPCERSCGRCPLRVRAGGGLLEGLVAWLVFSVRKVGVRQASPICHIHHPDFLNTERPASRGFLGFVGPPWGRPRLLGAAPGRLRSDWYFSESKLSARFMSSQEAAWWEVVFFSPLWLGLLRVVLVCPRLCSVLCVRVCACVAAPPACPATGARAHEGRNLTLPLGHAPVSRPGRRPRPAAAAAAAAAVRGGDRCGRECLAPPPRRRRRLGSGWHVRHDQPAEAPGRSRARGCDRELCG